MSVAIVVVWVATLDALAQAQNAQGTVRRVVVLNGTDSYLPAFLALDGAMRRAIQAGRSAPTELFGETLDMHRFPPALFEDELVALLKRKYRGVKVDVVASAATTALDFARRYGAEIWPDATIVFNSVAPSELRERSLDLRIIGVPAQMEFGATLELALSLRPATRRIAVIAGAAEADRRILAFAREPLERHAGRREVRYLVGLTVSETVAAVRALPADAVVLYLSVFRDGAGSPRVPRDVLQQVASASTVPVFGVFETYIGHGIVVGSIASFQEQGQRVGDLVVRVLNGEDPSAIGVQAPVAPGCIADWRQLRRWGIRAGLLPEGCEVRFREVTAWDRYHWHILGVLAVILAQSVLIASLLMSRRRVQRVQTALHNESGRRRQAETIATSLTERLARFSKERSLGAMATAIAHEVNQPLIAIQNYAQAARRRLQGNADDKAKLVELVLKIEGQAERAGNIIQRVRSLVTTNDSRLVPVSLVPLGEEVLRLLASEAGGGGCRIACSYARDLPSVLADPLQVQLVLVNLLRNAVQSVCSDDRSDKSVAIDMRSIDGGDVQVSVTDNGPGVPPERFAEIFEPLFSGNSGGMGMGLTICRDIIAAHGGRLWYEPNPGGGAIFRFTLRTAGS